jgi:hypothetical protein
MPGRKKGGNLIFLSSYRLPGISIIGHSKPFSIFIMSGRTLPVSAFYKYTQVTNTKQFFAGKAGRH